MISLHLPRKTRKPYLYSYSSASITTLLTKIKMKFPSQNGTPFKKYKTCTVSLSSYTNTSGSLGDREMLWEHEPQASVSTAFSSFPKLSRVFV